MKKYGEATESKGKNYPIVPVALTLLFALLFVSVMRTSIFGQVNGETHLLFEISFLLLLAMVAEVAVVYLKQPSVVLLLVLGVLVSQSFVDAFWPWLSGTFPIFPKVIPHFISDGAIVQVFGQLGAIFILLKVGLHVKFRSVFNAENALVATLGVAIPFIAGYAYALWSGGGSAYALFLGASFTATSVGITAALLREFKLMETRFAEVILGAAIIDDVLGLLVLSFVSVFSSGSADLGPMAPIVFNAAVFLVGGVLAGRYFVRNFIDRNEMDYRNLLMVLSFAFVYAYLAEYIGLSSIVGAFLAGIILNESRHLGKIEEKTDVLEMVFAPIFFISLGMLVDVQALMKFIVPILMITAIAIVSKLAGCGLGSLLIKLRARESAIVGVGMVPRGEVALIVGLIGLTKGVLDAEQYTIIASMAFLTAFLMPFLMQPLLSSQKAMK
ncbi:MAG: cation:proton antiporter [Candidatus ainarchaeum sp.]|nr:cation:proton antiporter [Candidatus ainarchaeum sp.]